MSRRLFFAITAWLLAAPALHAGGGLRIVDDPALGEFLDITRSGLPLDLTEDEELSVGSFGGNFVFAPGLLVVGQNGGLGFGIFTVTDLSPQNQMIPSSGAFAGGQSTLALWDDIDDKDGDAYILEEVGRVIVQWNWADFDGAGSTLKFQIQVFDNSAPSGIYAQYLYAIEGPAGSAGASATIGYQDGGAGFGDIQFSFNQPGAITDGTVLTLLIPRCPADTNGDGAVNLADLVNVILDWGGDGAAHGGDVNGDGVVDVTDLMVVVLAWGDC